jgi:hypothetical protein
MSQVIKLNIGGIIFHTTRETLQQSTFFSTLLSTEVPVDVTDNNEIFIDRSPDVFHCVLKRLRGEPVVVSNLSFDQRLQLIDDVKFYDVASLQEEFAVTKRDIVVHAVKREVDGDRGTITIDFSFCNQKCVFSCGVVENWREYMYLNVAGAGVCVSQKTIYRIYNFLQAETRRSDEGSLTNTYAYLIDDILIESLKLTYTCLQDVNQQSPNRFIQ